MACASGGDPGGPTFDAWLASLQRQAPLERSAAVEARIATAGGTPLVGDGHVLFLVRRNTGDATPRVVGDFNAWGHDGAGFDPTAGTMTRIAGTPWFFLHTELPDDARIEYLIDAGEGYPTLDPRNPHHVRDIDRPASELAMPRHVTPLDVTHTSSGGGLDASLVPHDVVSRRLGATRTVLVRVPRAARADTARYPVVYFTDGSSWIRQGLAARVIDQLVDGGVIRPIVAVFVDPGDRATEYNMSSSFRRFMVDELLPSVESRFPVDARRESRAVVGSSLGALAALDLVLRHGDTFGFAGLFSPTTKPHDPGDLIGPAIGRPLTLFVVGCAYDRRWLPDAADAARRLQAMGHRVTYRVLPQGHSFAAWREELGHALRTFVPAGR